MAEKGDEKRNSKDSKDILELISLPDNMLVALSSTAKDLKCQVSKVLHVIESWKTDVHGRSFSLVVFTG